MDRTEQQRQTDHLAVCLDANKDAIIRSWLNLARSEVPAAEMQRTPALVDHLPQFLSRLVEALSDGSSVGGTATERAIVSESHGVVRAHATGYSLFQVLREYSLLRQSIFVYLDAQQQPALSGRGRDIVLNAIDMAMCDAAKTFVEEKMAEERLEYQRTAEERDRFYLATRALLGEKQAGRF